MSQWISVKERLPEEDGAYLWYGSDDGCFSGYYYSTWDWEDGEIGCASYAGLPLRLSKLSHWMPLPEPPKGE